MSMNLPLVASKHLVGSLAKEEGVYAVDPMNSAAVSTAMQQAVTANGCGRDIVQQNYSRQVMAQGYENLFQSLVDA
jgi:hypothetical protein